MAPPSALRSLALSSTLLLTLWTWLPAFTPVHAGIVQYGEACDVRHQRLEEGTFQFITDCDAVTYCNSSSLCDYRGCRRVEFPFGYVSKNRTKPDLCPEGKFCPDEEDACQEQIPFGKPCQFNRDDQCQPPPNKKELRDTTGFGLNVDGAVCLNNVCMWADVTVGLKCEVQNTAFIAYSPSGEFANIVSRGNCRVGLYCDAKQLVCVQSKKEGEACDADKECETYNCLENGKCGRFLDEAARVPIYVFIIIAVCILLGMAGTLYGLYFVHKKHRAEEREKRLQYWREQNAFRQNIRQMQETAAISLQSFGSPNVTPGGSPRSSAMYRDQQSEVDSQAPMLGTQSKNSGLRYNYVSDDGSEEDHMHQQQVGHRF